MKTIKTVAKAVVFSGCVLLVSPLALLCWLELRCRVGERAFEFCAQILALLPGQPGAVLRGAFYWSALTRSSWESSIGFGSVCAHRETVIGRHVTTGSYCVFGRVQIDDNVRLASRVSVSSGKRQHLDATGRLSDEPNHYQSVRIGAGSWIGEGAILLADIGRGCIVGAGAVVTRPVEDGSVVAGNPARVLHRIGADPPSIRKPQ